MRLRLRALESIAKGAFRSMEMVADRVAVLVHDKSLLDAEDVLAANILVYGNSSEPLVKKSGSRWFVTPENIGSDAGGRAVLDDESEEIVVSIYASDGKRTIHEALVALRQAKMKVQ